MQAEVVRKLEPRGRPQRVRRRATKEREAVSKSLVDLPIQVAVTYDPPAPIISKKARQDAEKRAARTGAEAWLCAFEELVRDGFQYLLPLVLRQPVGLVNTADRNPGRCRCQALREQGVPVPSRCPAVALLF